MNQITLYTNTQSRGMIVEWLLAELEEDYKRVEVAFNTEMKQPDYLAIHPFGKVPALVDGDVTIYETAAICAYLADKFIDKGLAPALNDPMRALYYRWLFLFAGPWEAGHVDRLLGVTIAQEQESHVGYGNYSTLVHVVMAALAERTPYLCGSQFTAADIFVGTSLLWGLKMGELQENDNLSRYLDQIKQRPSFQPFAMIFA